MEASEAEKRSVKATYEKTLQVLEDQKEELDTDRLAVVSSLEKRVAELETQEDYVEREVREKMEDLLACNDQVFDGFVWSI